MGCLVFAASESIDGHPVQLIGAVLGQPGGPASALLAAGQEAAGLLASAAGELHWLRLPVSYTHLPPGNRDPLPEEVLACAPYLDAQIEVVQPEVILLLGRHALQRLLPDSPGISRAHGTLVRQGRRTYMPCYHPAATLYNGSLLGVLRQDFQRLRAHLDQAAATPPPAPLATADPAPPDEQLGLF